MKQFNFTFFITFFLYNLCVTAQVTLVERDFVTDSALFFDGPKYNPDNPEGDAPSEGNTAYRYGPEITPDGPNSIDVIGDYIYLAWYKGGMDERNVMLSRRLVSGGDWVHLTLPHKHIGFRGDPFIGDSHNYIAVQICPIDNTIHMVYDLHSYNALENGEDDYFNYSVSIAGGAIVEDSNWTTNYLFENQEGGSYKRNYLKEGLNYEDGTYPEFSRTDSGELIYNMRYKGSGNGDHVYSIYDGSEWSGQTTFNNGIDPPSLNKYSMYGGFKYLHGKYRNGFSVRYKDRSDFEPTYQNNSGLYYAHANFNNNQFNWYTHEQYDFSNETPLTLPIQEISDIEFLEASEFMQENDNMFTRPAWTVTENEAIHFLTGIKTSTSDWAYGHYFKTENSDTVTKFNDTGLDYFGDLFSYGNYVYMVALDEDNRIEILRTLDNESVWTVVYNDANDDETERYTSARIFVHENKIYVYAMLKGDGDAKSTSLLVFDFKEDIVVEAEDYDYFSDTDVGNNGESYRNDNVDIQELSNASNGHVITDFRGDEWLEYTITVETPGIYEVYLHGSNRRKDVSQTEFVLDDTKIGDFNVSVTGDFEKFTYNKLPQTLELNEGQHTFKLTQKTSLSSRPDKIRFVYQQPIPLVGFDIEAEDYDNFYDTDPGNSIGDYDRDDDVDIEALSNASNGHVISEFKGNEWLEYTITVETPGIYEVYLRASRLENNASNTTFTLDGDVIGDFNLSITGEKNLFTDNKLSQTLELNAGEHTFRLTQNNSLSSRLDKIRFVYQESDNTLAVNNEEDSLPTIKIYPTQAKNAITIAGAETNASYEIFHANGKIVLKGIIRKSVQLVDTSELSSGLYFVRILRNNKIVIKKIIII